MPRLGDQLRDISTEAAVVAPGRYSAVLSVEDTKSKKGKDMVVFTYTISGGEFDGKELKEYNVLTKDNGEANENGLRSIKRVAVTLLADRAASEDFDTAELNDLSCEIIVKADSFEDADTGETVNSARVKRVLAP